jgi:hypothetical protein
MLDLIERRGVDESSEPRADDGHAVSGAENRALLRFAGAGQPGRAGAGDGGECLALFHGRSDQGPAISDQEARTVTRGPCSVTREKRDRRVVPTPRPLTANPRAQAESLRHEG